MPAKAGIQNYLKTLDSRLRGNDAKGRFKTFYEGIKNENIPILRLRQITTKCRRSAWRTKNNS
jgi:hypothetical protein